MKNFKLIISAFLFVSLIVSCKKTTTDDTEKFIGTWVGTNNITVPGLGSNASNPITIVITKGTAAGQIILTGTGSTNYRTANTNGNSYTMVEYNFTTTNGGASVSVKMNGTGTLNGSTITETGTIAYTIADVNYPGTWSSTMTKQ